MQTTSGLSQPSQLDPRASGPPAARLRQHVWTVAMLALVLASVHPTTAAQVAAPAVDKTDFDTAMRGLRFDPAQLDANLDTGSAGNGILDADEMALIAAILRDPTLDLRQWGGIDHGTVRAAFLQALQSATGDVRALLTTWPTAAQVVAGYAMLGNGSFDSYNAMSTSFGAPLTGNYELARSLGKFLAFDGDADGDGATNLAEYLAVAGNGRSAYIRAALDPAVKPSPGQRTTAIPAPARSGQKTVGVVLYPGFEVLDVYGPLEMWSYVPDFKIVLIAEQAGAVRSAQGVSTLADYSFATAPALDILMVPGGLGTRTQLQNSTMLAFLRDQHGRTELTTSVCTGSALLAKAGILKGHRATSNKAAFALAVEQAPDVDWIVKARWVEDGKIITSSGVSAGTDMALALVSRLYGKERARRLARSLEYEWHENASDDPFALSEVPRPTGR